MFQFRVALGFLLMSGSAVAQQYVISTFAGGSPPPTPAAAVNSSLGVLEGVAVDGSGTLYLAADNSVFRVDVNGVLIRLAGNSRRGFSGDGDKAVNAQISLAVGQSIAVDGRGNIFIADYGNQRIRRVAPDGAISTAVGGGTCFGGYGDGRQATAACLNSPGGVAVDAAGNLYIADANTIRKVASDGIISTVAGIGTQGYSGDGDQATKAQLGSPYSVAVDPVGNIYIADYSNSRIRKVALNGIITTVAGNGTQGYSGDGGQAINAQLNGPVGVAIDAASNIYIADDFNYRLRKVSPSGVITTVAGSGGFGFAGDGGPATDAQLRLVLGVAVDPSTGALYAADYNRVRKISPAGVITTAAGDGGNGDGGAAINATLAASGLALDPAGNLYIADSTNRRVRKVSTNGIISTVAGNGNLLSYFDSGDGGPATNATLFQPSRVAADAVGNIYISGRYAIRKVSASGIITTIAGNGTQGYSGDGGSAINAQLSYPFDYGIAVDNAGNLYIADAGNQRVRKVSPSGIITTIAGNGGQGFSGDGGPAKSASLSSPAAVALDGAGNIYIEDQGNARIRRVSPNGIISTVAGDGTCCYSGDGGPAVSAKLGLPVGMAVDTVGNIYISAGNYRIVRVSPSGTIATIAGDGTCCYSGDGGPATSAKVLVGDSAVGASGQVYLTGASVRLLTPVALGISSVTNAASNLPGSISPGEIVVLYGSGLGPNLLAKATVGSNGLYPTQLAGTSVQINGVPAPMIYAWATQVAGVVPYGITGTTAQVTVTYQGQTTAAFSVPVASSAPGLFSLDSTGTGQAAAINQDGFTVNTAANPAKVGDVISLYATGEGQTAPPGVDGKPAGVPLPQPNLPVTVTIGGQTVRPQYAGGGPGEVAGVMQINVQIPSGIQTGNSVPVVVQVGSVPSQPGVTIAVR